MRLTQLTHRSLTCTWFLTLHHNFRWFHQLCGFLVKAHHQLFTSTQTILWCIHISSEVYDQACSLILPVKLRLLPTNHLHDSLHIELIILYFWICRVILYIQFLIKPSWWTHSQKAIFGQHNGRWIITDTSHIIGMVTPTSLIAYLIVDWKRSTPIMAKSISW